MSDDPREIDRSWADRHYTAIGKVAAKWASFESEIDVRTLLLADFDPERGACLTSQITGAARKLEAYMAIAKLCGASDDTMKKLHKFLDKTYTLADKRNRIVHDQWFVSPSGPAYRFEITARRKLVMKFDEHKTEDINLTLAEIGSHIERFKVIDELVYDNARALSEKP